jgi:hypothetical protein
MASSIRVEETFNYFLKAMREADLNVFEITNTTLLSPNSLSVPRLYYEYPQVTIKIVLVMDHVEPYPAHLFGEEITKLN